MNRRTRWKTKRSTKTGEAEKSSMGRSKVNTSNNFLYSGAFLFLCDDPRFLVLPRNWFDPKLTGPTAVNYHEQSGHILRKRCFWLRHRNFEAAFQRSIATCGQDLYHHWWYAQKCGCSVSMGIDSLINKLWRTKCILFKKVKVPRHWHSGQQRRKNMVLP